MRQFLLGVVTTLVVLAVACALVLASLGTRGAPPDALPAPAPSGVRVEPPADLRGDETWLGSVDLSSTDVVSGEGDLVDVTATGTGVRFGPRGTTAATLALDATLPFATVEDQVGHDVRLYAVSGGLAGVQRTATLFGRDWTIRATAAVRAEGGQLVIEPETVDLGGPRFVDRAVSAAARALVTFHEDVPGVPDGLVLREVSVDAAGFAVSLDGSDVRLG